jgi:hypothetical protein
LAELFEGLSDGGVRVLSVASIDVTPAMLAASSVSMPDLAMEQVGR